MFLIMKRLPKLYVLGPTQRWDETGLMLKHVRLHWTATSHPPLVQSTDLKSKSMDTR